MRRTLTFLAAAVLVCSGTFATAARADVDGANGTNVQDGRNTSTTNQSGSGKAGSAVGGQVAGVVTSGRASVNARNTSRDSDVTSGDARGTNSASNFVGLNSNASSGPTISDISTTCHGAAGCANVQDGSDRYNLTQTLNAITGDAVGGQVIGLIAGRGGSSITASNTSDNVDVTTGDADGTNSSAAFVGLNTSATGTTVTADLLGVCTTTACRNVQDGRNDVSSRQSANIASGDGVAGQVIGATTRGSVAINAKNTTTDSSVETGHAEGGNSAAYFVGLNTSTTGTVVTADVTGSCLVAACSNVQDGSNRLTAHQSVRAASGDGVAGQVIGAASTGGSVSVKAANTSTDSDVTTGGAGAGNSLAAFVGLNAPGGPVITSDVTNSCNPAGCTNVQDGTNRITGSQLANATTGDGVAGEVIGILAAGRAWLNATNHSDDVSSDTGDADAHNHAATFVGLNASAGGPTISDISGANATNLQDGANRKTLTQNASATSGDAVAGQVSGIVTGAGGASVTLANATTDVDASSGHSDFSNGESGFVGLNVSTTGPLI